MQVTAGLCHVGTYHRNVAASLERVWENVRDWEHLPWLHAGSFHSIDLLDSGDWGWRARIGLQPQGEIELELVIDAEAPRYVSRTLSGTGAGGEIWTQLRELSAHETAVGVEFHLPDVPAEAEQAMGEVFTALYTRLWDEDEAMMVERERQLARGVRGRGSGRVALGSEGDVRQRAPFEVDLAGRRFRVLALERGDLAAHPTVCPHRLGPLAEGRIEGGALVCPWHGFRFDLSSGQSCDGRGLRLLPQARVERDANGQCFLSVGSD